MHRIMLVDDEENVLHSLNRYLRRNTSFDVTLHTSPVDALQEASESHFDLFLSDYRMPEMDGVNFLVSTKHFHPNAMRLILSGTADFDVLIAAINKAEIYRYIAKPVRSEELLHTLKQALQLHDIIEENRRLSDQVRIQGQELKNRDTALKKFATEHPVLASVQWGPDGSIILDERDT